MCRKLFLPALLTILFSLASPHPSSAHPMGNFSISHYAAIHVERDGVELQYVVDMAEIPTYQEIQRRGKRRLARQQFLSAESLDT
jgi:hypothetical protein